MKKFISILLAIITAFSISVTAFAREYSADDFDGKEPEVFCKIKKSGAVLTTNMLEKVELWADYYVGEDCEFIWSVEGKSNFIKGETKKTAKGENVTLRFIDDSTVKLKIVSQDGRVLAEDEKFLESYSSYANKGKASFFDRVTVNLLMSVMIIWGIIGVPIGSIIGLFYDVFGLVSQ